MGPRANHRGWVVVASYDPADGLTCVDIFEDPAGGFGFEYLRSDPEDGGRWTAVGGFAGVRHASAEAALEAACEAIGWLAAAVAAQT